MRAGRCAVVIFLGMYAGGSTWAADILHSDGRYTQTASGMVFPLTIDEFRRGRIVRFLRDGTDEGIDFTRATPMSEIGVTVNVYPATLGWTGNSNPAAGDLCKQQFRQVKYGVAVVHPDAALVEEGATMLAQNGRTYSGYRVKYRLTDAHFFNRGRVALQEDIFMLCNAGRKWTVQYTFDYPMGYHANAEIARFMHDLRLTIRDDSI